MSLLLTSSSFSSKKIWDFFVLKVLNKKNALIITTAAKEKNKDKYAQMTAEQFSDLGFDTIDMVDLEFSDIKTDLQYDVIYVCGGNTFRLLKFLKEKNFKKYLTTQLDHGCIYVGVSAGSLVLCPSIKIAEEVNPDTNTVNLGDLSALSLVPFVVFPHYKSEFEENLIKFEKKYNQKVIRLKNGEAVFIENLTKPQYFQLV